MPRRRSEVATMDLPAHGAPSNRTTEACRIVAATEDGFRHNRMSAPNVGVRSRRADAERIIDVCHIHRRPTFDPALTPGSSLRRPARIHRHARQRCSFTRSTICPGSTGHAAAGVAFWPDIDLTATAAASEKADHLRPHAGFVADNRCGRISATTRRGGRGRPCRSMDDAACSSPWPRSDGSARG
jgi:hypothetical protein